MKFLGKNLKKKKNSIFDMLKITEYWHNTELKS